MEGTQWEVAAEAEEAHVEMVSEVVAVNPVNMVDGTGVKAALQCTIKLKLLLPYRPPNVESSLAKVIRLFFLFFSRLEIRRNFFKRFFCVVWIMQAEKRSSK